MADAVFGVLFDVSVPQVFEPAVQFCTVQVPNFRSPYRGWSWPDEGKKDGMVDVDSLNPAAGCAQVNHEIAALSAVSGS